MHTVNTPFECSMLNIKLRCNKKNKKSNGELCPTVQTSEQLKSFATDWGINVNVLYNKWDLINKNRKVCPL